MHQSQETPRLNLLVGEEIFGGLFPSERQDQSSDMREMH